MVIGPEDFAAADMAIIRRGQVPRKVWSRVGLALMQAGVEVTLPASDQPEAVAAAALTSPQVEQAPRPLIEATIKDFNEFGVTRGWPKGLGTRAFRILQRYFMHLRLTGSEDPTFPIDFLDYPKGLARDKPRKCPRHLDVMSLKAFVDMVDAEIREAPSLSAKTGVYYRLPSTMGESTIDFYRDYLAHALPPKEDPTQP